MEFALMYELMTPKGERTEFESWWQGIEQVEYADKIGFKNVWITEHHFLEEFSHTGAPEMFLAACAMRTTNIRLGHGVVLVPHKFNHPVRVAERIAALDIISKGRVDFGFGRGSTVEELEGFEVPFEDSQEMMLESIRMIPRMWEPGKFSCRGRFVSVPPRSVIPKPIQSPHPPIWMACGQDASIDIAAELGVGMLSFTVSSPEVVGERVRRYRAKIKDCVAPVGKFINERVAGFAMMYCAETDDQADAVAGPSVEIYEATLAKYLLANRAYRAEDDRAKALERDQQEQGQRPRRTIQERLQRARAEKGLCVGSPASIIQQIRRNKANGVDQMMFVAQLAGVTHEQTMESLRLFEREVMPAFT